MKSATKLLIFPAVVLGASLVPKEACAYDREAAIAYARMYTSNTGKLPGVYNASGVYNQFVIRPANLPPETLWSDCANYVSQVLQAGGLRFRSGTSTTDNILAGRLPELGTGAGTDPILSTNMKKYSRVFQSVRLLGSSLLHQRHGGVNYKAVDLLNEGTIWTKIKPGDVLMKVKEDNEPGVPNHAMFITGYAMAVNGEGIETKSYIYCAHSLFRKDYTYVFMNDESLRKVTRVIHLPDAPLLLNTQLWSGTISEANKVDFLQKNIWKNSSTKKQAGNKALYVEILFDSDMNVDATPEVKLNIPNLTTSFQPYSGNGFNAHGWYTGTLAGNTIPKRSWRGYLLTLPSNKNVVGGISVKAQASDGTYNDTDNELDEYIGNGTSQFLNLKIDTRKGRAKTN